MNDVVLLQARAIGSGDEVGQMLAEVTRAPAQRLADAPVFVIRVQVGGCLDP